MYKCNIIIVMLVFASVLLLTGCFTHTHTIGSGQHTGQEETYHQWYVLWGILQLNSEKDAGKLAEVKKYRITTKFGAVDCVINLFTGVVSIYRRTIVIEK